MATIINIRGTGGSGKSYLIHYLMRKLGVKNLIIKNGRPGYRADNNKVGYRLKGDVLIVGKYETDCGGCDQIKTQDEICIRVGSFAKKGRVVIFEGLLVSGLYSRYRDLAKYLIKGKHKFIFVFLDTSLEKCIKRTIARRKARGENRPFNPKHTILKYRAVELAREKAIKEGYSVVTISSDKSGRKKLLKLIRAA